MFFPISDVERIQTGRRGRPQNVRQWMKFSFLYRDALGVSTRKRSGHWCQNAVMARILVSEY
jgi:hypothetical protein